MFELFNRYYRVQVDTIVIDKLDIGFKVTKTLTKEPNTLELVIMNLNPDHRKALSETKSPVVQLEAGYKDFHGVIFLGDVRNIDSVYEKPDWVTTISSGDGEKATQFDRINKSFTKGTSLTVVLKEVASSMSTIGIGNVAQMAVQGKLPGGAVAFPNGITVSGNSSREMSRLVRSAGLEWSIQDKKFQLLKAGETLLTKAYVLTPNTGLIGSPTVGYDAKTKKGTLQFKSLLIPDILPGRQIVVKSAQVTGRFRIEKCEYDGDTVGQSWYVNGEASKLKI